MVSDNHNSVIASETPWLSIVIPIYNAEKYISRCIDSILAQSFTDYEVILVDDGSQDKSSDICKRYAESDRRLRFYQKINGGSYQARIFGAEHCSGEYVTFCDADDYYSSRKALEIIHKAAVNTQCSALQFGYYKKYNHLKRKYNTVSERLLVTEEAFQKQEYPKLLCSFWDASHLTPNVWNKVYKVSLITNLPNHTDAERSFWGDDLVMNLFLLREASSILYLPDCLYMYQQGSGETNSFRIQTMDDLDFIKRYQLQFLEARLIQNDKYIIESILHSETAGWFFLWVRQAVETLDEKEVFHHIERILQLPSFRLTRRFYGEHLLNQTLPARLINKGDPDLYILNAKTANKTTNKGIKDILFSTLKKVYVSI